MVSNSLTELNLSYLTETVEFARPQTPHHFNPTLFNYSHVVRQIFFFSFAKTFLSKTSLERPLVALTFLMLSLPFKTRDASR